MSTTCCKFCSCLLLWKVLCTGGKLSLKNKNCPGWRTSQVDQRFFFDPFLLPFPALHGSPMSLLQLGPRAAALLCRPCCPVGAEASRRRREQIQLRQHRPWVSDAWLLTWASGFWRPGSRMFSDPLLQSRFPPHRPSQGYENICLRLCSEDTHFKKEIITWINLAQLWRLTNWPLYLRRTSHSLWWPTDF